MSDYSTNKGSFGNWLVAGAILIAIVIVFMALTGGGGGETSAPTEPAALVAPEATAPVDGTAAPAATE